MALHTPIARKRGEPPKQRLPRGQARAKNRVLAFLSACGGAGPIIYIVAWIVAGLQQEEGYEKKR